jgi:PilZ domain
MTRQVADIAPTLEAAELGGQGDSLKRQVQGLIDEACLTSGSERRSRDRFPIPYTFRLVPIDRDGIPLVDETTTVVGKDLSLSGIGFSHDHPLPHRRAVISLDHPKVGRFAVEAEIVWTRQTPIGLYESGCRLVRTSSGHILRPNS